MIGIDVVDLKLAKCNSRWKEQRFLDILFSKEEQALIFDEDKRFENIWRLWSMKESAYKIVSRVEKSIKFNPRDFHCQIMYSLKGQVTFQQQTISTTTFSNQDFLYTTAFMNTQILCSEFFQLNQKDYYSQHSTMKTHSIEAFSILKSIPKSSISIRKNEIGVPEFYINEDLQREKISITHHGNFGGFAIAI